VAASLGGVNDPKLHPPPPVLLILASGGGYCACHALVVSDDEKAQANRGAEIPTVELIHPSVRDIIRVVAQPATVEAYERTSIFSKLTAYIGRWNVDFGSSRDSFYWWTYRTAIRCGQKPRSA
jgi:hypothetical protein